MHKLDITNEHCPMTLVKTRLKLEALKKGELLVLQVLTGKTADNIVTSLKGLGYVIISQNQANEQTLEIVIKK